MYKQIMFAIAAAVLLTALVSVASYQFNAAHAQNATGGAMKNATGGAMKNATSAMKNATSNMTKK